MYGSESMLDRVLKDGMQSSILFVINKTVQNGFAKIFFALQFLSMRNKCTPGRSIHLYDYTKKAFLRKEGFFDCDLNFQKLV